MHQKTDNIKIIKLVNGDDIVCVLPSGDKQLPDDHILLRVEQPLQIKYVPQMTPMGFRDYIALIRWTNYTTDRIITIPKDKILTITNASNEMGTSYYEICKNYQNLDKPKKAAADFYQKEELSSEQNKKLNEIFEEFEDDEEPTIH
jgi:hypothetical protein